MDDVIALVVLVVSLVIVIWQLRRIKGRAQKSAEDRSVATLARPSPKPNRSTRAIRTGWSRGDIEFTYEDSAGDISRRRVTVHSVDSTYIKGECHDRQAERTFRIDRIIGDLTDCETGEILSPRQWARKARA